ncbi:hypothetical protein CBOM_03034 [Ceraceosorus bombacis]|uniref:Uncharacterized protein n=1 Tax=Ceraceosorus bombacis TaxID=401625 RepID=A0A0P1BM45_9BASI|nr:hypothetical protein CBOM_03034 [Ceraceosorus bombacis]
MDRIARSPTPPFWQSQSRFAFLFQSSEQGILSTFGPGPSQATFSSSDYFRAWRVCAVLQDDRLETSFGPLAVHPSPLSCRILLL